MSRKIILAVMDGIGIGARNRSNAVYAANTPSLDLLMKEYPSINIRAHGTSVGLPSDEDMGNSEVGHNALGCGQIYAQGAKLVNEAFRQGSLFASETWRALIGNCLEHKSTLHFIGLLSDGNVHSNIAHLKAMIVKAKECGIEKVRVHVLLDGRDVPPTSALLYIDDLEELLFKLSDDRFDAKIASGGGRMKITMDRYGADWNMVKLGWDAHVHGIGRPFDCAREAINTYRRELAVNDQDIPPFVIAKEGVPVGKIVDNDSVVLFNFRGDRALEISMAFEQTAFSRFDRGDVPKVYFAGMLEYDGDLGIPRHFLVAPPEIRNTLSELLIRHGLYQYAVSETQKYGHVTYFWNGNRTGKFHEELETYCEIPSDKEPFDERPWMKSAQIADHVIQAMKTGKYAFIRCNFPNGDMVGHTGNYDATVIAVESVDLALARLMKAVENTEYLLVITSDHGNADEMFEHDGGNIKTSHSLNPIPFILCDKSIRLADGDFGLANVAPTIADLLGLPYPHDWEKSMLLNPA